MPSQKKIVQVKNLTEKLKKAKSVVLVDYKGLTHQQLSDLRSKLKEAGGSLMITKNTLLKLAFKFSHFQFPISNFSLTGPTATLFISADPLPLLKALNQFLNEFGLPKIKIGILDGEITEKEKILRLAALPPKEVLTAQVIGALKAPTQRLVLALNWNLQKLTMVLKKMSD